MSSHAPCAESVTNRAEAEGAERGTRNKSDTPLRGAAPINNEFEVGYDEAFEKVWLRIALAGRVILGLVVAAGLAGLLGRGPFSHHTSSAPDGAIKVDYEPVARFGTATQVTIHLDMRRFSAAPNITLHLSSTFVEPMGFHQALPQPLQEGAEGGGLTMTYPVRPTAGDILLRFVLSPTTLGPVHLSVNDGMDTLRWTQIILP